MTPSDRQTLPRADAGSDPGRGRAHSGAGGGRPRQRPRTPALGALDLGTNNCRLLIARPEGRSFTVVDAFSRAVRLGEGMEDSNRLSEAAQQRAIKALRICAAKLRQHGVRQSRIVATEACRRADNGRDFIRRASRETGLVMDIITAEEEARLAVAGCAPLVDVEAEQLLVFDIGGGSTELIWIDMTGTPPVRREALIRALAPMGRSAPQTDTARAALAHVDDWVSVPIGVSTLHDRFAHVADDPARLAAMSSEFEAGLASFGPYRKRGKTETGRLQIIGVSGTATTFGALHLGLRSYDRARVDGLWLPAERAGIVAESLISMGQDRRARHPGIGRGRSELVISGAAILLTILRLWPVKRIRVADRGLREGMLYGLIQAQAEGAL